MSIMISAADAKLQAQGNLIILQEVRAIEEAILEFKEVTRLYPAKVQALSREDFTTLSKAHYNLSLMYTKKGWWEYALKEAETCFELQPIKDHYDLVSLIKQRSALELSSPD